MPGAYCFFTQCTNSRYRRKKNNTENNENNKNEKEDDENVFSDVVEGKRNLQPNGLRDRLSYFLIGAATSTCGSNMSPVRPCA